MTVTIPNLLKSAACALLLAGCEAGIRGEPAARLVGDEDLLVTAIAETLTRENIRQAVRGTDRGLRNAIVLARIAEIDRLYFDYERALSREARESGLVGSLMALGAGLVGTLSTVEATTRAASAVSTAVAGVDEAFSQEVLVERTLQALTSQMRGGRAAVKREIFEQLGRPPEDYPLLAALSDLERYRQAGTLPGALLGLSETVGEQERLQRTLLENTARQMNLPTTTVESSDPARSFAMPVAQRRARLAEAVGPDGRLTDAQAEALFRDPPAIPAGQEAVFRQILAQYAGTDGAPASPDLARRGLRAVSDLLNTEADLAAWEAAAGLES